MLAGRFCYILNNIKLKLKSMLYLKIPNEIKLIIYENYLTIEGPLGKVSKQKSNNLKIFYDKKTNQLWFYSLQEKQKHFFFNILYKMIIGLWKGYITKLHIIGVGYKAFLENNILKLRIGFSHLIQYNIPENIEIKIITKKGLFLIIKGNNLQKIMQVANEIKLLRPAEPYKEKGIKFFKENIRRKEGKKTNA